MPPRPGERTRPSALDRVEHHRLPVRLDAKQRRLLDEALRRGTDLAEEVESKIGQYGRWLLDEVFDGDTQDALDVRTKNPVWAELVRRAGGPTLGISPAGLYTALNVAARDKRITDAAWRGLDAARKAILLPLGDDGRLRAAARHVADFKLTQRQTRAYLATLLEEKGTAPRLRLTGSLLAGRVRRLRESLDGAPVLRRVAAMRGELTPKERAAVVKEMEELQKVLGAMVQTMKGK